MVNRYKSEKFLTDGGYAWGTPYELPTIGKCSRRGKHTCTKYNF